MPRTIEERVDVLLEVGIAQPKKWAKVHGYTEPYVPVMSGGCSECAWYDEWKRIREHHLDETNFLFEVIGELATRCNDRTSKTG